MNIGQVRQHRYTITTDVALQKPISDQCAHAERLACRILYIPRWLMIMNPHPAAAASAAGDGG